VWLGLLIYSERVFMYFWNLLYPDYLNAGEPGFMYFPYLSYLYCQVIGESGFYEICNLLYPDYRITDER
jgi:hypothetical protein